MAVRKSTRIAFREALAGLFMILLASTAIANLICAVVYGAVFMVRGSGWTHLGVSPVPFVISVAASVVLALFGTFAAISLFVSVRAGYADSCRAGLIARPIGIRVLATSALRLVGRLDQAPTVARLQRPVVGPRKASVRQRRDANDSPDARFERGAVQREQADMYSPIVEPVIGNRKSDPAAAMRTRSNDKERREPWPAGSDREPGDWRPD